MFFFCREITPLQPSPHSDESFRVHPWVQGEHLILLLDRSLGREALIYLGETFSLNFLKDETPGLGRGVLGVGPSFLEFLDRYYYFRHRSHHALPTGNIS